MLKPNFEKADGLFRHKCLVPRQSAFLKIVLSVLKFLGILKFSRYTLMPSPSAFSKFGLSILNFFKHAQFFMYTQNHFGILKS